MRNISESEKLQMLEKSLRIIKEKGLTAYQIEQNTSLSATGVQKIIDGTTANPQKKTVIELYNFVTGKPQQMSADFPVASFPVTEVQEVYSDSKDLHNELMRLKELIKMKDDQLKDKDEIIGLLKSKLEKEVKRTS